MKNIDTSMLSAIQKKYRKIAPEDNYTKYVDIKNYLPRNLKRAYILNLHNSEPLDILDMGAGAGYFCLVCKHFGHNATAMDVGNCAVFDEIIELLKIKRILGELDAFKKLPKFESRFDLMTAFYVPFNRASNPNEVWGVDKWEFFLKDLVKNGLKEKGKLFFFLHPETDGKHYNSSLLEFFLNHGAKVYGQEVCFELGEKLRRLAPK